MVSSESGVPLLLRHDGAQGGADALTLLRLILRPLGHLLLLAALLLTRVAHHGVARILTTLPLRALFTTLLGRLLAALLGSLLLCLALRSLLTTLLGRLLALFLGRLFSALLGRLLALFLGRLFSALLGRLLALFLGRLFSALLGRLLALLFRGLLTALLGGLLLGLLLRSLLALLLGRLLPLLGGGLLATLLRSLLALLFRIRLRTGVFVHCASRLIGRVFEADRICNQNLVGLPLGHSLIYAMPPPALMASFTTSCFQSLPFRFSCTNLMAFSV